MKFSKIVSNAFLVIGILILAYTSSFGNTHTDPIPAYVKEAQIRLAQMVATNKANNEKGLSHLNNYVLAFNNKSASEGNGFKYVPEAANATVEFISHEKLEDINTLLKDFATEKRALYIAIDASQLLSFNLKLNKNGTEEEIQTSVLNNRLQESKNLILISHNYMMGKSGLHADDRFITIGVVELLSFASQLNGGEWVEVAGNIDKKQLVFPVFRKDSPATKRFEQKVREKININKFYQNADEGFQNLADLAKDKLGEVYDSEFGSLDISSLCAQGKSYYNYYLDLGRAPTLIDKEYLFKVAELVCEAGTDELMEAQKAQYEKWEARAKTVSEVFAQNEFSFKSYYNALINIKNWIETDVNKILTEENRDLLFDAAYALDQEVLSLLTTEQKLELLKILVSKDLYNLTTINQDKVVVKVVKAVKDEEASAFIAGITSDVYKDENGNPLIFNLKERISNFLAGGDPYTGFFVELKRLSEARSIVEGDKLKVKGYINWDVEQKDYVLIKYVRVNNDYEYVYDESTHTNYIKTCSKWRTLPVGNHGSKKECSSWQYILAENSSPFDLVQITFINDISPFGTKYINGNYEISGQGVVLPAIFIDYLKTNVGKQQLSNFGSNAFNIIITVSTLGEGAVAITAIRAASGAGRAVIIAKNVWVLADVTYTLTDMGFQIAEVDMPVAWTYAGYLFTAKSTYNLLNKNGLKGFAALEEASPQTRKKLVEKLGVKKNGRALTDTDIDDFITDTKVRISKDNELKRVYDDAVNEVIRRNSFRRVDFDNFEAVTPGGANNTNLGKTLFKEKALKITPTETNLKNKVDKILKGGGNNSKITEEISDILYTKDGFKKYNVKIGSDNGFDGLYIKGSIDNPTAIHIDEAKFSSNFNKSGVSLNSRDLDTGLPAQMSDDWVVHVADRMIGSSDNQISALGDMVKREISANPQKFSKSVTSINPQTGEINIFKLLVGKE